MDEQEKREEHNLRKERVVRWDKYRINQFSYTNNLLIALNLGFLSYFISQLAICPNCNCWIFSLQLFTMILLVTSFLTGMVTVFIRLNNFRLTALIVKRKKQRFEHDKNIKNHSDIGKIRSTIQNLQLKTEKLDNNTWIFLNLQMWTFLVGTTFGAIYILLEKSTSG